MTALVVEHLNTRNALAPAPDAGKERRFAPSHPSSVEPVWETLRVVQLWPESRGCPSQALAHEAFACTNDNSCIQYEQQPQTSLILFEMAQVLHGLKDIN